MLQKATELNATEIQPLITERTLLHNESDKDHKQQRWLAIARQAVEQCESLYMPMIHEETRLEPWLASLAGGDSLRLCLMERGDHRVTLRTHLAQLTSPPDSVVIAVGPEGGWTEAECALLAQAGFTAVSVGNTILRTETAAIAALGFVRCFYDA
jgi:16S rRNA (uracil1498-N3)-methyltransferase